MPVGKRNLSLNPNTVYIRELVRKRREQGLCRCGKNALVQSKSRCQVCLDSDIRTRIKLRKIVIEHYGAKCVCCGESEYKFLAVDHVEGNGNEHRKSVGGSKKSPILRWLIKNNFPPEFQLLCHNCNMAKSCYGVCPHQESKQVSV